MEITTFDYPKQCLNPAEPLHLGALKAVVTGQISGSPLTSKRQYDHVTETFIACGTCSILSVCRIYTLEQLTQLLSHL